MGHGARITGHGARVMLTSSGSRALGHSHCALVAGPPVEVGVTMYVLSISSVSEVLMVLTVPTLASVPLARTCSHARASSPRLEAASMYAFRGAIRFLCLRSSRMFSYE